MTQNDILQSVMATAKRDMGAARSLYVAGHYTWSLFMWHLVIEKTLKAVLITQNKQIVYTHNLIILYKNVGVDIGVSTSDELVEINRFNIEARYDFEKEEFYKKATKEYTDHWVNICERIVTKLNSYVKI